MTTQDFTAAVERIVAGAERKGRLLHPHERKVVAYHEMGHAGAAPVSFARLADCLRESGYRLDTLDARDWTERIASDPDNAAHAVLEVFAGMAWGDQREILLEPGQIAYPAIDSALFARQVRYLRRIGFLPPAGR